jgi:hypothetical protein
MKHCRIILSVAVVVAGSGAWSQEPARPGSDHPQRHPEGTRPATRLAPTQATVLPGPPYLQTPPVIQPATQVMPMFPQQPTVVPLPSQTPGSVFGPPLVTNAPNTIPPPPVGVFPQPAAPAVNPLGRITPGGMLSPQFGLPAGPEVVSGPGNPIAVPVADEELAWDQIADVVDDYFTISREARARRVSEVPMEGRIETRPQSGATWLEPHRRDSVGRFNRWESTFQTIRRRAAVRVIPDAAGYLVEVVVEKELENLPKPEHATAGAATFRNDNALPSRRLEQVSRTRTSPRWISLGRDTALEQRMLADIHARLSGVYTGPGSIFAR